MPSIHVDVANAEWTSGAPFYGPGATYDGKDIVRLKVLSDRRAEGGGIAWLARFSPPARKLIKIVAKALSDEHVFNLEGGRGTKSGEPACASRAPPPATRSIPRASRTARSSRPRPSAW